MLAQVIYPERWKFSLIKPIYKSGDKSSPSNYRPISLLAVFSKIFEKVLYNRLIDHLHSNVILNKHQYGFRSEKSTENASYVLLNEILTALNNKQMVGGIFNDLHKAFDCINHNMLLEKMKFYGVSGKFYNLIKSYLDGRFQKQVLSHSNGIESTWEKIRQGITQGSIVGPLLFLIYINVLPNLVSTGTKILLYADDTSTIVTSSNLENFETKIDNIFGDINNWFKVNQLTLNYNITNYLQFNTKNSWDCELKPNYQGNCIKSSSNTKFLSLTIDDSISWKAHVHQMVSKLNTACFVIRTTQAIMSLETLRMVYFAYIQSVISYGIIFWGNQP